VRRDAIKQGIDPDEVDAIREMELPETRPLGCNPRPVRLNNPFMVFSRPGCEGHATCAVHGGWNCDGTETCSDGSKPREVCHRSTKTKATLGSSSTTAPSSSYGPTAQR